jgi:hypothetical protein
MDPKEAVLDQKEAVLDPKEAEPVLKGKIRLIR